MYENIYATIRSEPRIHFATPSLMVEKLKPYPIISAPNLLDKVVPARGRLGGDPFCLDHFYQALRNGQLVILCVQIRNVPRAEEVIQIHLRQLSKQRAAVRCKTGNSEQAQHSHKCMRGRPWDRLCGTISTFFLFFSILQRAA